MEFVEGFAAAAKFADFFPERPGTFEQVPERTSGRFGSHAKGDASCGLEWIIDAIGADFGIGLKGGSDPGGSGRSSVNGSRFRQCN